jgi:threonine/homoserine/homoserine lactone efflux protein
MLSSCISCILSGTVFGLSGGLSPGPLLALVVSETVKHGIKGGIKVSIAPLLTDLPIILVTFFILSRLSNVNPVMGIISLSGAVYLIYLGYGNLVCRGQDFHNENGHSGSLKKGIMVNVLNPNPYMFWFTVGAPVTMQAWEASAVSAGLFIFTFYLFLIGSKVLLSAIIEKSRSFIKSKGYVYINRILGAILIVFALVFVSKGAGYLGIWQGL